MLRASLCILCLVAGSRQVSIEEFSVPNAVKAGGDAQLQCGFKLSEGERLTALFHVKWWWTPLDAPDDRQLIYQRIQGHAAQKMHRDNMEIKPDDSMLLSALSAKDSGVYECEVSNDGEDRRRERLVVYTEGTGPMLNVSTMVDGPDEDEEDDVVVTCEAFDVAPEPDLVISVDGKEIKPDTELVSVPVGGLYQIVANATLSRGSVEDGAEIACELFYKDKEVHHEPYKVTELFQPSGAGAAPEGSTTEAAAAPLADEAEPTPQSDLLDGGAAISQLSWLALLLSAGLLALH